MTIFLKLLDLSPPNFYIFGIQKNSGGVVKLVITSACHAEGRGFESRLSRHFKIKNYKSHRKGGFFIFNHKKAESGIESFEAKRPKCHKSILGLRKQSVGCSRVRREQQFESVRNDINDQVSRAILKFNI